MSTIRFLAIVLLLTGFGLDVSAPELFGREAAYGLHAMDYEIIFIPVLWDDSSYLFMMVGHVQNGTITGHVTQLLGERIMSYPPYDCSTETSYCYKRENKINWRGWIEFRGHNRPLCGGQKLPATCLIKEF